MSKKQKYILREIQKPQYTVFTDGGCASNPDGPGGYGVVIIDNETGEVQELSGGAVSTTNNRMEMMAVCVALESLPENATLSLSSDSQLFIRCFSGEWTRKKNLDLWERVDKVAAGKEIELNWVKGHAGNPLNERCDELATLAMRAKDLPEDEGYEGNQQGRVQTPQKTNKQNVRQFVAKCRQGQWIYPGVVVRELGIPIEEVYKTLEELVDEDAIEPWYECCCGNCGHEQGKVHLFNELPPTFECDACGSTMDTMENTTKIYKVLGKEAKVGTSAEIPDSFPKHVERMPVAEYAKCHETNESCARAILAFGKIKKPSFKNFVALRTGGMDSWSRKKLDAIREKIENADEAYAICLANLGDEKNAMTALRWYCRGLPLDDCIHKVRVDLEVAQNARP